MLKLRECMRAALNQSDVKTLHLDILFCYCIIFKHAVFLEFYIDCGYHKLYICNIKMTFNKQPKCFCYFRKQTTLGSHTALVAARV